MLVRIASTRPPKVNGVKKAVEKMLHHFHLQNTPVRFETFQVESGVADTPKSLEELMLGAQQRARAAFQKGELEVAISVGVEGGLFQIGEKVFLQSWCCVFDGEEFSYGSSGSIEIPHALADAVMKNGSDLGHVIDEFAQKGDVRSHQGTFGVLTDDFVTREDSFESAAIFALTPYFNKAMYRREL
ncbi:MAG: inosine/xanthosine triphosphatase [Bacteroidota bacterium]|nr:inosine/xanthosine triphosphatase [Bacteroidota bacterium]